jgi:hypothetical protein
MVGTKGRLLFNLRERQSTRMKLTRSLSFVTYAHAGAGGASAAALAAPRGRHRIQRSVLGRGRRLRGPGEEKTAFFFRFACRFKQRSFCQHRLQTEIILPRQASDKHVGKYHSRKNTVYLCRRTCNRGSWLWRTRCKSLSARTHVHSNDVRTRTFTANCIIIDHSSAFEPGLVAPFLYAA